ncbi:MAG: A24 family peptidase [Halioglobus sp.]|nr:A24 family peptidase [Halioglobus sp.]
MSETLNQLGWLLPACLLLLGLCVGSFLNVVIYRLPLMLESQWRRNSIALLELEEETTDRPLNLATPNSHCPHCGAPVKPWQNIPVVSYLLLRGKCGNCSVAISPRYPIIELITGLVSLSLLWHFPPGTPLLGALILTWALIALTMIDIDHQLLPDNITLPLLWLGLLFNIAGTFTALSSAVIGAAAGYLLLWSVYWLFKLATGKEGMGYGDFKLLAALGAWMGWQVLPMIILMSSVVGAVIGIALMVIKRRGREIPIAFGPYLAIAGWITFVWGEQLLAAVPLFNMGAGP